MPAYYQIDELNPFVSGAALGFEMFERAMDRRQQAADRKRALALEDERMQMAREDQDMQRQSHALQMGEYSRAAEERNVLQAGSEISDMVDAYGLGTDPSKWTPEQLAQARAAARRTSQYANADDATIDKALVGLAMRGGNAFEDAAKLQREREYEETVYQRRRGESWEDFQRRANFEISARRAEEARKQSEIQQGVRGILDLANRPTEQPVLPTTTPTGGQRGGRADGRAGAMTVTPAGASSTPYTAPGARQVRGALEWAEGFQSNPLVTAERWQAERNSITDPKLRESLDVQAANALKARADMLKQEIDSARKQGLDKEAAVRATEALKLGAQARDLGRKIAADKIATGTNGRPVRRGEQAATIVQQAVNAQSGVTPQAEQAEARALLTQMTRFAERPPQRFSEEQLNRVSRAVSLGIISLEQATNLTQYGRMDKPAPLEYKVVGDSLAIISERGIQFVDPSGGGGKGGSGGGLGSAEERLRNKENAEFLAGHIKGMVESGEFDSNWIGGGPKYHQVYGGLFEAITRFGPQIEAATGISLTAPGGGATSLARLDPGTAAVLATAYKNYRANELDASFKGGKGYDWYVAQELGVPAQAAQGATGEDWSVELLPD